MIIIDVISLKEYLLEDEDRIISILESLDFHHIVNHGNYISCGRPMGDNTSSTIVKFNESISTKGYTQSDLTGDILTLVMTSLNIKFGKAMSFVHKLFGLKYEYNKNKSKQEEVTKSPMDIFNKVKAKKKYDMDDIPIHHEGSLDMFVPNLHESWLKEGILSFTAREFGIGYDFKRKRIVIPHRLWNGSRNDYIGIIGRTTISNYELLDIPKYFPIIAYPKRYNIYGFQENYEGIQNAGYVSVFESEKSVLKRHSRLDRTGTALMCSDITDEQVAILIGLNVEIVIIMDKGIDINHIRSLCDRFYGIRNVSYVYDKYNLVPDKDSSADCENSIYNYLFKYRVKYDDKERREFYKWQESQKRK